MIYKRGKGASVYRSSGFRSYGCLMGLTLFPISLLILIVIIVISETLRYLIRPRISKY